MCPTQKRLKLWSPVESSLLLRRTERAGVLQGALIEYCSDRDCINLGVRLVKGLAMLGCSGNACLKDVLAYSGCPVQQRAQHCNFR